MSDETGEYAGTVDEDGPTSVTAENAPACVLRPLRAEEIVDATGYVAKVYVFSVHSAIDGQSLVETLADGSQAAVVVASVPIQTGRRVLLRQNGAGLLDPKRVR